MFLVPRPILSPILLACAFAAGAQIGAMAQAAPQTGDSPPAYADLADLSDSATLVIAARIRKTIALDPARAGNQLPATRRHFVTARTISLLAGSAPVGADLSYLADLPLDARGKPPRMKNAQVLLFARPVPGRPGEIQLVTPRAQILQDPATEASVRSILQELMATDAPARVAGVREAIHVPGALAGEGETQIFLATANGSAASITVRHRPGLPPAWGVSFSELVGNVDAPPARDSLAWYRLACFLPNALPQSANISDTPASRAQAQADYRMVLGALGECPRTLR